MRDFEFIAENITALDALRAGQGMSLFDTSVSVSPAGATVELKRFTFQNTLPPGTGFRVIGTGSVANNVNAKTVYVSANSLNPAGQMTVTPAVSTTNIWLIDVTFLVVNPNSVKQVGAGYTGPNPGAVTQTVTGIFLRPNFAIVNQFLIFGCTQTAAGDVTMDSLWVTPIVSPA